MMDPPYSGSKMEARDPSGTGVARAPRELEDPFRYGSRWVKVETPQGTGWQEVPLNREDLFDPQEDDYVTHSIAHGTSCWIRSRPPGSSWATASSRGGNTRSSGRTNRVVFSPRL